MTYIISILPLETLLSSKQTLRFFRSNHTFEKAGRS